MSSYTGSHPLEKIVKELRTVLFDIADVLDKPGLDEHPGDVVIGVLELRARTNLAEKEVAELAAAARAEPETLDEALVCIGRWGRLIRLAIEHEEVIPKELFTVSFRELTEKEQAYGESLMPLVEEIIRGE